jgi:hypothetical protein
LKLPDQIDGKEVDRVSFVLTASSAEADKDHRIRQYPSMPETSEARMIASLTFPAAASPPTDSPRAMLRVARLADALAKFMSPIGNPALVSANSVSTPSATHPVLEILFLTLLLLWVLAKWREYRCQMTQGMMR